MNCATISNNILPIDLESIELINMPTQFTSVEAGFLEKLLQQFHDSHLLDRKELKNFTRKKITVDFEKTTFMDSEGLVGLCKIIKFARDKKIDLSFSSFSPQVQIILSLIGLEYPNCPETKNISQINIRV